MDLTLNIEKPTAGGRMLARHDGQVVLVWGAIPGEQVRAHVERTGKGVLFAETIEVLSPSPDRRDAAADWRCGGNVLAHVSYPRQLQIKAEIVEDAFARIARMPLPSPPPVIGSPEQGYRMRARLHVRRGRAGFMREGTHEICAVGPTGQLLPDTVAWIDMVEQHLRQGRLAGLTSIEIAENVPATERAVHLEFEAGADRSDAGLLASAPFVTDTIGALRLRRDARAFFQGNRFLLDRLVEAVTALVLDGPLVDLYAGVGLFGLSLAARGASDVLLVEGDPVAGRDLEVNAGPYGSRVRIEHSSVEDAVGQRGPHPDVTTIVDPPRTGMSPEALAGVLRMRPARLVYVSCDVATLARDARRIVDAGYALASTSTVDLFPNTAHVETICAFTNARRPE